MPFFYFTIHPPIFFFFSFYYLFFFFPCHPTMGLQAPSPPPMPFLRPADQTLGGVTARLVMRELPARN